MTEPIVETTVKNAVLDNQFYITHANIPSESNDLIVNLKGYVMGAMASNLWNDLFGYEFGHIYDIANGIGYVDAMAGTAFRNLNCNCVGGWMFQICSNVDPTIDPATVTFDCNLYAPKTIFSITCNLVNSDVPIVAPLMGASNMYIRRYPVVHTGGEYVIPDDPAIMPIKIDLPSDYVGRGELKTVSFTGDYNDLINKPTAANLHPVAFSGSFLDLNNRSHTHTKAEITDFAHTHTKSQITDFAHYHTRADITNFAHTHVKSEILDLGNVAYVGHTHTKAEITDFAHNHTKAEITDFAHTHDWNTDIYNKPAIFSGNYNDLTNKPTLDPFTANNITANANLLIGSGYFLDYDPYIMPDPPVIWNFHNSTLSTNSISYYQDKTLLVRGNAYAREMWVRDPRDNSKVTKLMPQYVFDDYITNGIRKGRYEMTIANPQIGGSSARQNHSITLNWSPAFASTPSVVVTLQGLPATNVEIDYKIGISSNSTTLTTINLVIWAAGWVTIQPQWLSIAIHWIATA